MSSVLAKRKLIAHPDHRAPAIDIGVTVGDEENGGLRVDYIVLGAIAQILLPPHDASERTDELWRTTCFEAFIQQGGEQGYREFNFSPSTRWAAYGFDGYRAGMRDLDLAAISISTSRNDQQLMLSASFAPGIALPARLGLSAVIEDVHGDRSFWALAHPPGAEDFHHYDCFALELAAATDE